MTAPSRNSLFVAALQPHFFIGRPPGGTRCEKGLLIAPPRYATSLPIGDRTKQEARVGPRAWTPRPTSRADLARARGRPGEPTAYCVLAGFQF